MASCQAPVIWEFEFIEPLKLNTIQVCLMVDENEHWPQYDSSFQLVSPISTRPQA